MVERATHIAGKVRKRASSQCKRTSSAALIDEPALIHASTLGSPTDSASATAYTPLPTLTSDTNRFEPLRESKQCTVTGSKRANAVECNGIGRADQAHARRCSDGGSCTGRTVAPLGGLTSTHGTLRRLRTADSLRTDGLPVEASITSHAATAKGDSTHDTRRPACMIPRGTWQTR